VGASEGLRIKVILDANFLIEMAKGNIAPSMIDEAISYGYELLTTTNVVDELSEMAMHGDELSKRASEAAIIIRRLNVKVVSTAAANGDESIVKLAGDLKASGNAVVVATLDKELRRRLRKEGVPCLTVRGRGKRLELSWAV